MVALRDGRKLIGILRSWDQFGMGSQIAQDLPESWWLPESLA